MKPLKEKISITIDGDILGQYRTILGTRLACGYFRHSSQKSSEIQQGFPAVFISIDENPDSAIRAPQLCGVALEKIKTEAEEDDRSLSQYINLILKEHLQKGKK